MRSRACIAIAFMLTSSQTSGAGAQILRGRIIDASSGQPVSSTEIRLLGATDSTVRRTLADAGGRFQIKAPEPGHWRVGVARIGYRSNILRPIWLGDGELLDVEIRIAVDAIPLEALNVTAEPRVAALDLAGFYERREAGFGVFVDRFEVEKANIVKVTDLFERMNGMSVLFDGRTMREQVLARRGCVPRIFLDGVEIYDLDWRDVLPIEIDGLEVYRSTAEVPLQWGGSNSTCGVILVWTRHGE